MNQCPSLVRGRGRVPDPQRTAQTRDAILRSALDSFLERGFEATRMADVAERAGLAKGTLYLHFADKEALFEFVLQQFVSEPLARLREVPFGDDEGPRVRLERMFVPLLAGFEQSGRAAMLRLIIAEGSRFPALAAMHRRLVIEPMLRAIEQHVLDRLPESCRQTPLCRFPQLVGAPVIMAAVWNGLWCGDEKLDAAGMFKAFLDIVFGAGSRPADRPAQEA